MIWIIVLIIGMKELVEMTNDLKCDRCDSVLRERSYEEIMTELMDRFDVSRSIAHLMFIPRTGGFVRYWCDNCEMEKSPFILMDQILRK